MKLKQFIKDTFPTYSYLPLLSILVMHALVWGITKIITNGLPATDVTLPIDARIPLVPEWVVIYVLAFFLWGMGLFMIMRAEREECYKMFASIVAAEIICCAFFIGLPSRVVRPEIVADDVFSWALALIYTTDTPTNCFPSMHCLFAYMAFRQSLCCRVSRGTRVFCGVFAVLVFLSTLFVKQHVVVDVFGGIFFGEAAFLLGQKLPLWKIFNKINKKTLQNTL